MKNIAVFFFPKFLPTAMMLLLFAGCFVACQDDEADIGMPEILAVRLTDPETADSTFTASELGQTVVILGRNLATTEKVFFNDVEAFVYPTLIRNDNIILDVPEDIPTELNNLIRIVTSGGVATFEFDVQIPSPIIERVSLEMVSSGDVLTIQGDYFFSSEVTIGGVPAEVLSETQEQLEIVVGDGTTGGELTIATLFGENTYPYSLNDMGQTLLDWEDDGSKDCWAKLNVISPDDNDKPVPAIKGNYGHLREEGMGQTFWFDPGVITTCGHSGVSGNVSNMALKMEINIPEPIQTGYYRLWFSNTWEYRLTLWEDGPFTSDGWITVTIPLHEFRNGGASLSDAGNLADLWCVFINESGDMVNEVFNWNIDNVRIVSMLDVE